MQVAAVGAFQGATKERWVKVQISERHAVEVLVSALQIGNED